MHAGVSFRCRREIRMDVVSYCSNQVKYQLARYCFVYKDRVGRFIIIFFFLLLVLRRQQAYNKNQPVYGKETWHTDRALKPHVQSHTNITPVSFAAPSVGG